MKKTIKFLTLFSLVFLIILGINDVNAENNPKNGCSSTIITDNWGSAPVEFCPDTGALTVDAGILAEGSSTLNTSGYLTSANKILKKDIKTIIFNTGVIAPNDASYLFSNNFNASLIGFINLNSIQGTLDTSNITNASHMFFVTGSNQLTVDISAWNTGNITDMSSMFESFNGSNINLGHIDTSSVTNMSKMFYFLSNVTNLDLSGLSDTSKVLDMSRMFQGSSNLSTLNLANMNTSSVTTMEYMFSSCSALTNLDLTSFETNSVTNMYQMFSYTGLTTLDVSNFITDNVTNMAWMFYFSQDLATISGTNNWNTTNVNAMNGMFEGAMALKQIDVTNWNTANVTNMANMFSYAKALTNVDVSNFNTGNVTNMNSMFTYSNIASLDTSNWNTSKVTNIAYFAQDANNIIKLDLSHWNTSNITNMNSAFSNMNALTSLDLSSWDTSKVTDYGYIFASTPNLQYLNLGANTIFGDNTQLSNITNNKYTGAWILNSDGETYNPINPEVLFNNSTDFMQNYNGTNHGWYTWQSKILATPTVPEIINTQNEVVNAVGTGTETDPLTVSCSNEKLEIKLPEVQGVIYQQSTIGDLVYVQATAANYYYFDDNITTEWYFKINDISSCTTNIDFISVIANGKSKKIKTDKLTIKLSQEINDLTLNDINLSFINTSNTITAKQLINLGEGNYELIIDGKWTNQAVLNVSINKTGVKLTPDSRNVTIFSVVKGTGNGSGSGSNPDGSGSGSNPGGETTTPDGSGGDLNQGANGSNGESTQTPNSSTSTNNTTSIPSTGNYELVIMSILLILGLGTGRVYLKINN